MNFSEISINPVFDVILGGQKVAIQIMSNIRKLLKKDEDHLYITDTETPIVVTFIENRGSQTIAFGYDPPTGETIIIPLSHNIKLTRYDEKLDFSGNSLKGIIAAKSMFFKISSFVNPYQSIEDMNIELYPHQVDAVYNHILKEYPIRFLLADDVGAGKTIMAGMVIKELERRKNIRKVLVIAPSKLAEQWAYEMSEKFYEYFEVLDGKTIKTKLKKPDKYFEQHEKIIVSIDTFKKYPEKFLMTVWDFVIIDEAHMLSANARSKTKRYRSTEMLIPNAKNLLLLTATPHQGDSEKFKKLLSLIDSNAEKDPLIVINKKHFLRRTKKNFVKWDGTPIYPDRKVVDVKYKLSEDEMKVYNMIKSHVKELISHSPKGAGFVYTVYLRRFSSSPHALKLTLERRLQKLNAGKRRSSNDDEYDSEWLKTISKSPGKLERERGRIIELLAMVSSFENNLQDTKLEKLVEILKKHSDEKVIVFTEYKDTLDYISNKLLKMGFDVFTIHGGVSQKKRKHVIENFRRSRNGILIGTDAIGEGLNLQFARVLINYDLPWNPNRIEQRIGRVHRIGQKRDVIVYNLVGEGTHDEYIYYTIIKKLEAISREMNSGVPYIVSSDADVESAVENYINGSIQSEPEIISKINDLRTIYNVALGETDIEVPIGNKKYEELLKEYAVKSTEIEKFVDDLSLVMNVSRIENKDRNGAIIDVGDDKYVVYPEKIVVSNDDFQKLLGTIIKKFQSELMKGIVATTRTSKKGKLFLFRKIIRNLNDTKTEIIVPVLVSNGKCELLEPTFLRQLVPVESGLSWPNASMKELHIAMDFVQTHKTITEEYIEVKHGNTITEYPQLVGVIYLI